MHKQIMVFKHYRLVENIKREVKNPLSIIVVPQIIPDRINDNHSTCFV